MRFHTPPKCERCVAFNCITCQCKEPSSVHYKGRVYPFMQAYPSFLAASSVYSAPKQKRWHKVKTMDDIETPGARFI